jgi:parallel beta-helix repeat protein
MMIIAAIRWKKGLGVLALTMGFTASTQAATLYLKADEPAKPVKPLPADRERFDDVTAALRALKPGDTLYLEPGVHRTTLDLRKASAVLSASKSGTRITRIESDPGAPATVKGSDRVADWERVGPHLFVHRDWDVNSEQVFVDGAPLTQIGGTVFGGFPEKPNHPLASLHKSQGGIWPGRKPGGVNNMPERSFFYEASSDRLYVKYPADSLAAHKVEVSVRTFGMIGEDLRNWKFANLRFQHSNTSSVNQQGAVTLLGDHLTLDNIWVTQADGNGFDITGDDNDISNSRAMDCGIVGMKVRGKNATLTDNETSFNNTRGFNKWWEAGGAKFVGNGGLQDSEISGHRAFGNNGDGIWFDWANRDNRVHDSVSAYNKGMGLQYEASSGALIYDNRFFANGQRGIYLPNSSKSVVAHNLVTGNGLEGIVIIDERGPSAEHPEWVPRSNHVVGNVIGWNGKAALVLPADRLDNESDANLFVGPKAPSLSLGWGSKAKPIVNGLTEWRKLSKQDDRSWQKTDALPAALKADWRAQDEEPTEAAIRALTQGLKVPADLLSASLRPGAPATPGPRS